MIHLVGPNPLYRETLYTVEKPLPYPLLTGSSVAPKSQVLKITHFVFSAELMAVGSHSVLSFVNGISLKSRILLVACHN